MCRSHNKNFPDSLLQQFNFRKTTEAAAAKKDWEAELKDKDQPALKEAKSAKLETNNSQGEEEKERDSREEKDEAPKMVPPKRRQRHIIKNDADELEEEQDAKPSIFFLSNKGKEKVLGEDDSEEDPEDIDVKLDAVATKVTRIAAEKKSLLDITTEITITDSAATPPALATLQQTPTKSPSTTLTELSKHKWATS